MIEMRFDCGCVWLDDNQTNYNKSNQWTIRISNDVICVRDHVSWNSYFYANDRIILIEEQEDETSMAHPAIDVSPKSGYDKPNDSEVAKVPCFYATLYRDANFKAAIL